MELVLNALENAVDLVILNKENLVRTVEMDSGKVGMNVNAVPRVQLYALKLMLSFA